MFNRISGIKGLALISLFLLSLVPGLSMALGLSAIKLESSLDQPLKAKIELLGARAQEIESLDVSLADI